MEIKMVNCPNGHYYNAALHNVCPECGAAGTGGSPAASAGNFGKTEAPYADNFGRTEAPGAGGGSGIGPTIAADVSLHDTPAASADPFGHTVIGEEESSKGSYPERTAPVAGWLVCIEGPLRGTDFRIHNGYNYIGREEGDIHIQGDMQVSRKNHAMVAYDSSERAYYVGPAEGRNLIKVNGKTVMNPAVLNAYDIISIGTTKLMFVPLCGPHFSWEEGTE